MLVLILGVLGADIFLPRLSLVILLAGLIILFFRDGPSLAPSSFPGRFSF